MDAFVVRRYCINNEMESSLENLFNILFLATLSESFIVSHICASAKYVGFSVES